ncbi:hypothetical protein ACLOJK_036696 [Asimina triloba]
MSGYEGRCEGYADRSSLALAQAVGGGREDNGRGSSTYNASEDRDSQRQNRLSDLDASVVVFLAFCCLNGVCGGGGDFQGELVRFDCFMVIPCTISVEGGEDQSKFIKGVSLRIAPQVELATFLEHALVSQER